MKFLIMAGHSASGNIGSGAVGYIDESNENRKVAPKVVEYLTESVILIIEIRKGSFNNDIVFSLYCFLFCLFSIGFVQ